MTKQSNTKNNTETKKEKKRPIQCRNWCFTIFTKNTVENYIEIFNDLYNGYKDIIRYLGFAKETCPKTKRLHIQGWIQLKNKKTLGGVQKLFSNRTMHLEAMYGSENDNLIYCKKTGKWSLTKKGQEKYKGKYYELGEFITQGRRSDIEEIQKKLDEQEPMYSVAKDYFGDFIRYHSGFYKYAELVAKEKSKKFRKVEVIFLSGKTGTGKTRKAMEEATFKITGDQLNWWDGYENDKCILIDEYSNQIPITKLLNLLDGYQLRLPIKGSHTYANWNKVYVTTNLTKDELHPFAKSEHQKALIRRIKTFANVTKGNTTALVTGTSKSRGSAVRRNGEESPPPLFS